MKTYLDTLPPEILHIIISHLPLRWDYEYLRECCGKYFYTVYHNCFIHRNHPGLLRITQSRIAITPCTCYRRLSLSHWKEQYNGRQTPPFGNGPGPCLAPESVCITKQLMLCRHTWPRRFVF